MLAIHHDRQERAYQDILQCVSSTDADITLDELKNMKYLEWCIKESLRLFPTVPMIGRTPSEPFVLKGHEIPVGVPIMIGIRQLHRKKEHWGENADKFEPERFKEFKDNGAFLPFSQGSRNCVGECNRKSEEGIRV